MSERPPCRRPPPTKTYAAPPHAPLQVLSRGRLRACVHRVVDVDGGRATPSYSASASVNNRRRDSQHDERLGGGGRRSAPSAARRRRRDARGTAATAPRRSAARLSFPFFVRPDARAPVPLCALARHWPSPPPGFLSVGGADAQTPHCWPPTWHEPSFLCHDGYSS